MIVFVAEYPNDENIRDGMMIRIKEIDDKYAHLDRIYLDISFFRTRKNGGKPTVLSDKLTIHHLNFFRNFLRIYSLLFNAEMVYVQAIFNYVKVWVFLSLLLPSKIVALDLHGAIPEELSYQNNKWQPKFYSWVEQQAFARCNHFMHVTNAMRSHFLQKYPVNTRVNNFKDYVLGIYTSYETQVDFELLARVKKELNWKETDIWFIYSGGIQDWQNVPLVIKTMQTLNNPNYRFLILTGSPDIVKKWVETGSDLNNKIIVKSVAPKELKEYYSLCNYGFVLRNPSIVNKVSNPTKLSEYLAYGMLPIVLDPNIGDYLLMGFEYKTLGEIDNNLIAMHSNKNMNVYHKYIKEMKQVVLPFL